jgi:hypothetical protein
VYTNWPVNLAIVATTAFAVLLSVLVHYEGLVLVSRGLLRLQARHQRVKVLYAITAVLALHVLEIWIFGLTLWGLLHLPDAGSVHGAIGTTLFDAVYLSAVTYSTVGYGDLAPTGPIRFLAATESLVGLVLITWSASFTYLEMERFWRRP